MNDKYRTKRRNAFYRGLHKKVIVRQYQELGEKGDLFPDETQNEDEDEETSMQTSIGTPKAVQSRKKNQLSDVDEEPKVKRKKKRAVHESEPSEEDENSFDPSLSNKEVERKRTKETKPNHERVPRDNIKRCSNECDYKSKPERKLSQIRNNSVKPQRFYMGKRQNVYDYKSFQNPEEREAARRFFPNENDSLRSEKEIPEQSMKRNKFRSDNHEQYGYPEGYTVGYTIGYAHGYADGFASRDSMGNLDNIMKCRPEKPQKEMVEPKFESQVETKTYMTPPPPPPPLPHRKPSTSDHSTNTVIYPKENRPQNKETQVQWINDVDSSDGDKKKKCRLKKTKGCKSRSKCY